MFRIRAKAVFQLSQYVCHAFHDHMTVQRQGLFGRFREKPDFAHQWSDCADQRFSLNVAPEPVERYHNQHSAFFREINTIFATIKHVAEAGKVRFVKPDSVKS
ncbi:hypothetical protein [Endozoicomonas sp. SCSIO W0465]|uniref:hypothetical protein n=1 Tax=Endozoicomonas sp. SCSIO W0465 TaxID=2918516 RepID=UPI0020766112|nr:hypothetical protein [Endozoicomonas sp. SCSIO W0465]USE35784.1 hypothetical protein MJO57_27585 [Endozoicomonas sp. SCSIO W0465]